MNHESDPTEPAVPRRISRWGILGLVTSLLTIAVAAGMPWIMGALQPAPPPVASSDSVPLDEFSAVLLEEREQPADEANDDDSPPSEAGAEATEDRLSLRALAARVRDRLNPSGEETAADDDEPGTNRLQL
ncbi:MAG: hypothetical protein WD079_05345, partial [Phycisphaeraceae bacterium]